MHFSIPETEELFVDPTTKTGQHTAFHLHVNGVYHCTLRYSQLFDFHEKMKTEFGQLVPPDFPPKKLLGLTQSQLEQRRSALEVFVQRCSQEPAIAQSPSWVNFLMKAQKEVQVYCEQEHLDIFLINGKKVELDCLSTDRTDEILEAVCKQIGLSPELTYYFGLFLVQNGQRGGTVIRRLQDFESPFISLSRFGITKGQLQLRKHYWSRDLEDVMYEDKTALNLIYTQVVHELKHDLTPVSEKGKQALNKAKSEGNKIEFMKLCRTMPGYGAMQWENQLCSYPLADSINKVLITFGELVMIFPDGRNMSFGVSRIRCWKISGSLKTGLELGFHYLKAKDELIWIYIKSPHAILMSMFLQSVVDELLRLRFKKPLRVPGDRPMEPKPIPRPKPDGYVFTRGYENVLSPADYFDDKAIESPYLPAPKPVEPPPAPAESAIDPVDAFLAQTATVPTIEPTIPKQILRDTSALKQPSTEPSVTKELVKEDSIGKQGSTAPSVAHVPLKESVKSPSSSRPLDEEDPRSPLPVTPSKSKTFGSMFGGSRKASKAMVPNFAITTGMNDTFDALAENKTYSSIGDNDL